MDNKETKEKILNLWRQVERIGINPFIAWLENTSDFFEAPCSTEFHLVRAGGLAEHSLNVYEVLRKKVEQYNLTTKDESIIITSLGHDLCKTNFYTPGKKNVKENGKWIEKDVYLVKDKFPMGHGEKSVSILQNFMHLTQEECLAIRWHMCAFDASIHFNYPNGFAFREASKNPLVVLLFTADYEASQIVEAGQ